MLVKELKQSLKIAIPVSVSQLSHMLVGIADTIMAGNLGNVSLASATLATSVFYPILMFGIGISYGQTSIVSQYHGMGLKNGMKKLFGRMLMVNSMIGLFLPVVMILSFPFLSMINQPKVVVDACHGYYVILAMSIIPIMVFQSFKQFAEGHSVTKASTFISLGANILNVILNFAFIPAYGLEGIAIATLISRTLMAIAIVVWFHYRQEFGSQLTYALNYVFKFNYEYNKIISMLKVSVPVSLQMVMEAGAFAFAAFMVGWIGVSEIGAHQISLNIAATAYMIATGIGAAATVRAGNAFGSKNIALVKQAVLANLFLVLTYNLFTASVFLVFGNFICRLYTDDPSVIEVATSLLVIAAFFQISDGLQVVLIGILRGISDVQIPALTVIFAYWVIGLPLGYVLAFSFGFGAHGVWYGLLIGLTIISFVLVMRLFVKVKALQSEFSVNNTSKTQIVLAN